MKDLKLVQTCGACPEQYDVYDVDNNEVGYMRLRHGYFYAEHLGKTVYEAEPEGDGVFDVDEREYYLSKAKIAIQESIGK